MCTYMCMCVHICVSVYMYICIYNNNFNQRVITNIVRFGVFLSSCFSFLIWPLKSKIGLKYLCVTFCTEINIAID